MVEKQFQQMSSLLHRLLILGLNYIHLDPGASVELVHVELVEQSIL